MVVEIIYQKCRLCGGVDKPICIDVCPTTAVSLRENKIVVTEFLCEDCNECGFHCPDVAIKVKKMTF